MTKQILIIDDVHQLLTEGLAQMGYKVTYLPFATRNDLLQLIPQAYGLIVRTKTQIDAEVIGVATNLRFIGRAGAGLDNVDEEAAMAAGILVFNAGEANADAVGEHTLAMLLTLFTRLNMADREVRAGIWDREGNRGVELSGKTVGIIGYGNTGKAVARKLSGFNVKVLAYDKYLQHYTDEFAQEATMDEIRHKADVLTLHVPLTEETRFMVDASYLRSFSKDIYLLNLCRGEVVKASDLMILMEEGKVKGAALDVLENEKLTAMNDKERTWFNYIANSDRTVLSPHVAGWTKESYEKISSVLLKKIKDINLNESVS